MCMAALGWSCGTRARRRCGCPRTLDQVGQLERPLEVRRAPFERDGQTGVKDRVRTAGRLSSEFAGPFGRQLPPAT